MATKKSGSFAKPPKQIPELVELRRTARELERHEEAEVQIRAKRDMLIYKACQAGASERVAAEAAGVSPTYAHRAKADKGNPRSGPVMDRERHSVTKPPEVAPKPKRIAGVF